MKYAEALGRRIELKDDLAQELSPMNQRRYKDWVGRVSSGAVGEAEGAVQLFCLFTTTLEPSKHVRFERLEQFGKEEDIAAAETAGYEIMLHLWGAREDEPGNAEGPESAPASSGTKPESEN